jgi:acyl carrier protein
MREAITAVFDEIWRDAKASEPPQLHDDTVLLETGLDSMAFAVLVMRLDEDLGFDPFSMDSDPVYPRTFKQFVDFYKMHAPR